jgi:hypothetical protein
VRSSYYDAHLESEAGKKLWAALSDDTKTIAERKKAVDEATDDKGLSVASCAYLDDLARARTEKAEELHTKGVSLANAEGDARDLKGALAKFEQACKLGHEKACRQVPLTKALLSSDE